jgi:hypothetical protein
MGAKKQSGKEKARKHAADRQQEEDETDFSAQTFADAFERAFSNSLHGRESAELSLCHMRATL